MEMTMTSEQDIPLPLRPRYCDEMRFMDDEQEHPSIARRIDRAIDARNDAIGQFGALAIPVIGVLVVVSFVIALFLGE